MSNLSAAQNNTGLSISLPIFDDPHGAKELMEANMADVDSSLVSLLTKVKVPSGGAITWKVPNEDGEGNRSLDEIIGVIIHKHKMNGYYKDKYTGTNAPPDCSSRDGVTGYATDQSGLEWAGKSDGQSCATCPMNQYGSGEGGKGKACKNMMRIFMLRDDELFPTVISVPPTSIGNWKNYMASLTSKKRAPFYGVVTGLTLKEDRNDGGIVYSKIAFSAKEKLSDQQTQAVKVFADSIKNLLGAVSVEVQEDRPDFESDDFVGQIGTTSFVSNEEFEKPKTEMLMQENEEEDTVSVSHVVHETPTPSISDMDAPF